MTATWHDHPAGLGRPVELDRHARVLVEYRVGHLIGEKAGFAHMMDWPNITSWAHDPAPKPLHNPWRSPLDFPVLTTAYVDVRREGKTEQRDIRAGLISWATVTSWRWSEGPVQEDATLAALLEACGALTMADLQDNPRVEAIGQAFIAYQRETRDHEK